MAWSGIEIHSLVAIVLFPLVLVHHAQADRCTQRDTKLCARLDLYPVLFIARRRDGRLTRPSPCHLRLNIGFSERHAWRTAVDYASYTQAM